MSFSSYRQCFCLVSPSIQPKESNLQPRLLNTFFGMIQAEKNVEREILKNEHLLVGKKFVLSLKATPLFLPYMIEFSYYILFGAFRNEGNHCEDNWTYLKVPMKRNFVSHIFEIYCLKYTIPKFYLFRVKIDDFISLQSCAILPSKVVREWVRVKPQLS